MRTRFFFFTSDVSSIPLILIWFSPCPSFCASRSSRILPKNPATEVERNLIKFVIGSVPVAVTKQIRQKQTRITDAPVVETSARNGSERSAPIIPPDSQSFPL